MNTIYFLPATEQRHFIQCRLCRDYVDTRNLSEAFYHDAGDCVVEGATTEEIADPVKKKYSGPLSGHSVPKMNNKIRAFLSQLVSQ